MLYSCHRAKNGSADNSIGNIKRVDLIWSFRDTKLLNCFAEMIEQCSSVYDDATGHKHKSIQVVLHLYCTFLKKDELEAQHRPVSMNVHHGRPNLSAIFASIFNRELGTVEETKNCSGAMLLSKLNDIPRSSISVLACGPRKLCQIASDEAYAFGVNFQDEEFHF